MMKALGGDPCLKFRYCEKRAHKERLNWFSAVEVTPSTRHESCWYPRHQNLRDDGANLRISFKYKCVHQNNTEIEEIKTVDSDIPKSVRVRFKLQRECAFGDQFLVVGNEPGLGLWEPSRGLPLNWSDEHVWLGEVDLPSCKSIDYKFVLRSKTGTITWQVGPDRVLETWDTDKVITVFDDWDSPQPQNVAEEEDPLDIANEELSTPSVAEDLESRDSSSSSGDEADVAFDEKEDYRVNVGEDDLLLLEDDDKVPFVLVPGLDSLPTEEIGENKVETEKEIDDDSCKPEFKDKNAPASASSGSSIEEEEREDNEQEKQPRESSIAEGDMRWGRRTIQKFLSSLGFH